MSKKRLLPVLLTLIIWAGMYYYYLPALNIHSNESWGFFVAMVAVALVINFWTLFKATFLSPADTDRATRLRRMKRMLALPLGLCVVYLLGVLLSSPILRAAAYRELLD